MKLGNSNGNNRGKKYVLRSKQQMPEETEANREKYNEFSAWFATIHRQLVNFLKGKQCYDEDVYFYTFLRMSEKILFMGETIKNYKAYFHRAYYTNYIQQQEQAGRFTKLVGMDRADNGLNDPHETELRKVKLENDIFDYVYARYGIREFEIFKMYVSLKPAINYQTLSDITSVRTHVIQRIISQILKDIRSNKHFVSRYREIA